MRQPSLCPQVSQEELDAMVEEIDKDGDGTISFNGVVQQHFLPSHALLVHSCDRQSSVV